MYRSQLRKDGPLARSVNGGCLNIKPYVAAAALNRGDFVLISSGQAAQAIALPGSANSASASGGSTAVLGVCAGKCDSGATVDVIIADDQTEFMLRLYNSTASSAEQQDVTLGTAYQYSRYRGAGSTEADAWYVLSQTTTNGECIVTEKSPTSAAADDYGIVWVKIAAARRALG